MYNNKKWSLSLLAILMVAFTMSCGSSKKLVVVEEPVQLAEVSGDVRLSMDSQRAEPFLPVYVYKMILEEFNDEMPESPVFTDSLLIIGSRSQSNGSFRFDLPIYDTYAIYAVSATGTDTASVYFRLTEELHGLSIIFGQRNYGVIIDPARMKHINTTQRGSHRTN